MLEPRNTSEMYRPDKDTLLAITPQFDDSSFLEEMKSHVANLSESKGFFVVRTANRCIEDATRRSIPQQLYKEFWHESEVCILFADTNLGKSILAVCIAVQISQSGIVVLYFDFELSDKQFEARYSENYQNHYKFSDNFYRAEINPNCELPDGVNFEDYLSTCLERALIETGASVLIIDNLTYLKTETEKAKDALPLMKHLKALKNKYNLSILALAHTPKRDLSKPITRNDLAGSKALINFCDSAFAIGESSQDKHLRYLKQIKARATEIVYDSDNVCLYQITKPCNFLQFDFIGYGNEREHLRQQTEQDQQSTIDKTIELKKQGRSLREIGKELGISHMKVSRILKEM